MSQQAVVKATSSRRGAITKKVRVAFGIIALAVLIGSTSLLKAQDKWQIDPSSSVAKV